jgi:nucleotide-binding universal stress UspA family protein
MFANVLVGVDGSSSGRDALALARRLACGAGSLTLAHVRSDGTRDPHAPLGADDALESSLRLLARERAAAGNDVTTAALRAPSPGRGLHVQAEEQGSDLIVVGSCGHAQLGHTTIGDAMRSALNGAPCPVAIACAGYSRRAGPLRSVGVAYNRTRESDAALSLAREIAEPTRASVRALEVVPVTGNDHTAFVPAVADAAVDVTLREACEHMDHLDGVDGRVAYGLVGEELAAFGTEVDILLVGSRGYGPTRRVMLGSTSEYLGRRACSSLLVLARAAPLQRRLAGVELRGGRA